MRLFLAGRLNIRIKNRRAQDMSGADLPTAAPRCRAFCRTAGAATICGGAFRRQRFASLSPCPSMPSGDPQPDRPGAWAPVRGLDK
jgi:hypothetical protein